MASDRDLLAAYLEDCNTYGPGVAWVMWEGRPDIDPDDLIAVGQVVDQAGPTGPPFVPRCTHPTDR